MKAKDLARWLLLNPDREVYVIEHNELLKLNTITEKDKNDINLFDKNDDNGLINLIGDYCSIQNNKFIDDITILSHQKNYKEEEEEN